MKKIFCVLILLFLSINNCFADYSGNHGINNLYTTKDGQVSLGFNTQPTNTCNFYGWYIIFDASIAGGKNMLSILLAAKASSKSVNIWYTASTASGTNQNTGCNESSMAKLDGVAIP
ncbi:MAG: hypothetical protein RPU42_00160 [Candidatus Sedimenticola sp. (ex Thyasira tokunagai)]